MPRTTDERGILFMLDVCLALVMVILICVLAFFVYFKIFQFRLNFLRYFEKEQKAFFVDSLLKRSTDENGFAEISVEQRRVLENRISNFEKALEKNKDYLLANNVIQLKINGEEVFSANNKKRCEALYVFQRAVLIDGKFGTVEVVFCD
ncbi:MAG: hypothetical protein QXM75_01680 [Candidatus Diapherotrites archaeon]